MSNTNTLRVHWTITPRTEPHPWLHCSRCRGPRGFRSSGRIRVNANGRRIDAWLIYRCVDCDGTWNRPVVERREVSTLDRQYLLSLQANDPALVRTLAYDAAALKRWTDKVQEFDDVLVKKRVIEESRALPVLRLEIECRLPHPIALRTIGSWQASCACPEVRSRRWRRRRRSKRRPKELISADRCATACA